MILDNLKQSILAISASKFWGKTYWNFPLDFILLRKDWAQAKLGMEHKQVMPFPDYFFSWDHAETYFNINTLYKLLFMS